MTELTLVLGGTRSGKSKYAEQLVVDDARVTYIATATAGDDEMRERIEAHRIRRPPSWDLIEEPVDLASAVRSIGYPTTVLLDSVSIWVSNLMLGAATSDNILNAAEELVEAVGTRRAVIVTAEVGLGILPDNVLARRYADALGATNQLFASAAAQVYLLVAGVPLRLR